MKDLKTIQYELDQLATTDFKNLKRGQAKRILARIQLLKTCQVYISTSPSREFLVRERDRLETLTTNLASQWELHQKTYVGRNTDPRKWRGEYEADVELKKHRSHLRTLRYLLS